MILLNIIIKEIKHIIRDKKSMFMMTIFPIIMILILGSAFSQSFSSSNSIAQVKVLYLIKDELKVGEEFEKFSKEIEKNMDVSFIKIDNEDEAKESIKNGKVDCYIKVDTEDTIELNSNNIRDFNATLVETLVNTFVEKYNLLEEVYMDNPLAIEKITEGSGELNFVKVQSVANNKTPRSIDYYAISMFTMTILYGCSTGIMSMLRENSTKTKNRIYVSSASRLQLMLGKIVGGSIATSFQVIMVFLCSKYIIGSNWGDNVWAVLLVSFTMIIMSVCMGVGSSYIFINPSTASIITNILIPLMVFLGGGYIPLNVFNNEILNSLSKISPIRWTNKSIFQIIYENNFSTVGRAISINLITALVFIVIPILLSKRGGKISGEYI